jgi:phosphatidate cytidylyltransferase
MNNELLKRIITSVFLSGLSIFFIINGPFLFSLFLIIILYLSILEWRNLSVSTTSYFLGISFLILSIISAFLLKNSNFLFFWLVILISVFSDIGGFVFGKVFKGPKLTKISPNKTYSGVFGSLIFSLIIGFIYINYNEQFLTKFNLNYLNLIMIIILISIINQIGDLIISYFKRLKNIKNTGKILPGHGGLLDRIDGIIFTIPSSYIMNLFLS